MSVDDKDDSTDDFLLFQWGIDSDTEDAKSSNEEDVLHIDFAEEISRLTLSEVGDCVGDLDSVVKRIGSPFLHDCNPNYTSQNNINNIDSRNKFGSCIICNMIDLRRRENIIKQHMGTMAKCRGKGGDTLREAGAISSLLYILWRLIVPTAEKKYNTVNANDSSSSRSILIPNLSSNGEDYLKLAALTNLCSNYQYLRQNNKSLYDEIIMNEFDMTALDLATACLASLRDLACGSAPNRAAILSWIPPSGCDTCVENGVHVICAYTKRYDQWKWEEIITLKQRGESNKIGSASTVIDSTTYTERGRKELRLLTNALGVIRNATHSTPDVCQEFFNQGLVDILVWRIMPESSCSNDKSSSSMLTSSSLPDASCPWREPSFRAAASLINLAEKCPDVAYQLAADRTLIYLLIETWGGAGAINIDLSTNKINSKAARSLPVLHLGLAAVLNAACVDGVLEGGLDNVMAQVLEKEKIRKWAAQRREEERKLQQMKQKNR